MFSNLFYMIFSSASNLALALRTRCTLHLFSTHLNQDDDTRGKPIVAPNVHCQLQAIVDYLK